MKYFHLGFSTPFGFGTYFYRGAEHPLMPVAYKHRTSEIAFKLGMQQGVKIDPEAITYVSVIELPEEVAKARWPKDFQGPAVDPRQMEFPKVV